MVFDLAQQSTLISVCSFDQIKAVAAFAGLEITVPAFELLVDNKKPDYLSKFPHGKVPAFEGADGFKLAEGAAIARYSESSYRLSDRSQSLGWDGGGRIVTGHLVYFEFLIIVILFSFRSRTKLRPPRWLA